MMRFHAVRSARPFSVPTLLALFLLVPAAVRAEPTPGPRDGLVARLVCNFVQKLHLTRPELDPALDKRLFQRFLKDVDPTKGYFLQSDIDEFAKSEPDLDKQLQQGDLSFAYKVYSRFQQRVSERLKLIEELVNVPHDFTKDETLSTDFDKMTYAHSDSELRERWRKRIKFDLLLQRLGTKPVPDAEAKQKVLTRYKSFLKRWKEMDNYDIMELYLTSLTTSIDPHSTYMSPATLDDFDISMRLNLEGIGAVLRSENGQTVVVEVVPGGAAGTDGRLKANDKIIGVAQGDDRYVDVVDMKLRDVVKLIRGHSGTKVQLKVMPGDKVEPKVYALTRQKIELKEQEARGEIIEAGKTADGKPIQIGIIDLPSFYADMSAHGGADRKSATEDVRKILKSFIRKGVDGVVLDLRRNGGGSLNEALSLTGLFIDQGPIVQVKGFQGRVQRYDDPEKGVVYDGPLMVLESRLSASASEILAGALEDYGRALIVGDSATHGKGTVQMVIDLGDKVRADPPLKLGALKLTIQQFYRVNGDSTQNRGVAPDIIVPSRTDHLGTGEKELDNALPFDHVEPVDHAHLHRVPADLVALLKARSAARIKESKDFAKLAKETALMDVRRARKEVTLNEKELRDEFGPDGADKAEQRINGNLPMDPKPEAGAYKFTRNYTNNEILHIMEDYVQGKRLLTSK